MKSRVENAAGLLGEYYRSRQGVLHLGASVLAFVGLAFGKNRIAALGAAIFGFVVFPVTVVAGWRARQNLTAEVKSNRRGGRLNQPPARQIKKVAGEQKRLRQETQTLRRALRPVNTQLRRLERRVGRLEVAGERNRNGLHGGTRV